ncbi:hypothetical protein DTO212C5_8015 [Paecilomyces variotii]|nr:hypothetical protein DTO212C5_8015 [Paecilomyces variotii]
MSLSNLHAPPPSGPNCSGVGSSASCETLFGEALSNTSFAEINILDQCMHVPQTLYGPSINTLSTSTPFDQSGISEWLGEHTMQYGSVEENSFADLPSMSYDNSASNNYHPNPSQIPTEAPPQEKDDNDAITGGNVPPRRQHRPGAGRTNSGHVKCRWEGCTYTGDFSRDTTLWRHIKAKHLFPSAFVCRVEQCQRAFGRKDKYDEHMRDAHGQT